MIDIKEKQEKIRQEYAQVIETMENLQKQLSELNSRKLRLEGAFEALSEMISSEDEDKVTEDCGEV